MHYYAATAHRAGGVISSVSLGAGPRSPASFLATQTVDSARVYALSADGLSFPKVFNSPAPTQLMLKLPFPAGGQLLLVDKECRCYRIDPSAMPSDTFSPTASGELIKSDLSETSPTRTLGFCSATLRFLAVHMYREQLQILPIRSDGQLDFSELFSVRIRPEGCEVLDMVDLSTADSALVGLLLSKSAGAEAAAVQFRAYGISLERKELVPAKPLWKISSLDPGCHKVFSCPNNKGALLIVSREKIFVYGFLRSEPSLTVALPQPGTILAHTFPDGATALLGSSTGKLFKLNTVPAAICESVCDIPYPSDLAALGENRVFVASMLDGSSLVDIGTGRVLQRLENLGCVEDMVKTKSTLVACSNHLEYSSLDSVGTGFAFHCLFTMQMDGLCDLWTVIIDTTGGGRKIYIALGFVAETRLLRFEESTCTFVEVTEFACPQRMLVFARWGEGAVICATESELVLFSVGAAGDLAVMLRVKKNPILHAVTDQDGKLLATCESDCTVHLYQKIDTSLGPSLAERLVLSPGAEVAGMAVSASALAVSCWDNVVRIYTFGSTELPRVSGTVSLPVDSLVRSLEFSGPQRLICGTADGRIVVYDNLISPQLCTEIGLGLRPVRFSRLQFAGASLLAACCDTVTVMQQNVDGTLRFLPANFSQCTEAVSFIPFDTDKLVSSASNICYSPGTLAVAATPTGISLGVVQDFTKSIRASVRIGEGVQARRIVFVGAENLLVVLAERSSGPSRSQIMVFDAESFELRDSTAVGPGVSASCLLVYKDLTTNHVSFVDATQ